MHGLSCSFYWASPPIDDRRHCSGIDWLSPCRQISAHFALKIHISLLWFERLIQWWERTMWSMNCSLWGDECTDDVTLILPLNDSVDHLTLSLSLSYTFSEARSTKLPILQWVVTPWKLMDVWWTHGAKMKWKEKKRLYFWSNLGITEIHFIRSIY